MKKILALVLSAFLLLAFAACGDSEDTQSSVFSAAQSSEAEASAAESKTESSITTESSATESSEAESGTEASTEESAEESTNESSEESGSGELKAPDFIGQFVSFGTVDTKVNASSANSVRLTAVDADPVYGAITLYTSEYGVASDDAFEECAIVTFEYDHKYFGYVKKSFKKVGEAKRVEVPKDGFVLAVHSTQNAYIEKLEALSATETAFPHGVHLYDGYDYTVKKTSSAPNIDGVFDKNEWKNFKIEDINADNLSWSYAQFEVGNYYSTSSYYVAYDKDYLYLCVVVDSPYHYCPITQSNAGDMWQYECIQVKVSSEAPNGDYIFENFDHVANGKAAKEGVVRSYGFAANDNNETCYYEGGITTEFTGKVACSRDDAAQQTVYEVAIPFAEFEITPEKGMELGFTFSVNSTNEVDKVWKNVTYRNGGGIIGRNDWSKIPVITLG
ncbi:MAG: hypothetical protein IKZ05_07225 [Clostridia bacterium]|nr:hypothetical protein [Clostridia bacterium]